MEFILNDVHLDNVHNEVRVRVTMDGEKQLNLKFPLTKVLRPLLEEVLREAIKKAGSQMGDFMEVE